MQEDISSLIRMLRRFEDESYAESWLTAHRWPEGVQCPVCRSERVAKAKNRLPLPYRCKDCRTQFSVKSHSAMQGSRLPCSAWAQAFYLSSSVANPARLDFRVIMTVNRRAAWHLAHRIREAWDVVNEIDTTEEANP